MGRILQPKTKLAHSHVLDKVNKVITTQDANVHSLYDLMLLVQPQLKLEDVRNKKLRLQAIKELLRILHPVNFPRNSKAAATYEGLQLFYERYIQNQQENAPQNPVIDKSILSSSSSSSSFESSLSKTKSVDGMKDDKENTQPNQDLGRNTASPLYYDSSESSFRPEFYVGQKWPFLLNYCRPLPPSHIEISSGKVLAPLVAYQCINARGSIVHGKRPSLIYSWDNVVVCSGMSVLEIFAKYGGHILLNDVQDIKAELMRGGPVVSTTFVPDENIDTRYKGSIVPSRKNKYHYCLIVGWSKTISGDVWLVQNFQGNAIMRVPFSRYHIEDIVACPKSSNLRSLSWDIGPYYDRDLSYLEGWLDMKSVELEVKSKDLEQLAEVFNGRGLHQVMASKERFVLRDCNCQSLSRSCTLIDIYWDKNVRGWRIKLAFTDTENIA